MGEKRTEYAKILGKKLAIFRSYFKLSQVDMAKRLGCSQRYISMCESGRTLISTQFLLKFHEEYQVPMSYFELNGIDKLDEFFKNVTIERENMAVTICQ